MNGSRPRARLGEARAYLLRMVAAGDRSSGCWEWPFGRNSQGYGVCGKSRVHRVAFEIAYGTKPQTCRHTCDNPPCFNPAHLLDGTMADNARDAVERSRLPTVLTAEDVVEMRHLTRRGWTGQALAARFNVSRGCVSAAVSGRSWGNLPGAVASGRPPLHPCGTVAAYVRHRRRGETPCGECVAARAAWDREAYWRRKSAGDDSMLGNGCSPGAMD